VRLLSYLRHAGQTKECKPPGFKIRRSVAITAAKPYIM